MTQNYLPLAGTLSLLLLAGCASVPSRTMAPRSTTPPVVTTAETGKATAKEPHPVQPAPAPSRNKETTAPPTQADLASSTEAPAGEADASPPSAPPQGPLAVLRVEAGALVTQVNGDPKIRCTRPDCSIPLTPGTHRVTVLYRDTTIRAGSKVTYASMYPRVVELTLEPGHRYSMTASGRYSQKWWIEVEDRTTDKVVYDDRKKSH